MDYVLGFSWKGLAVFLLTMLPNLAYFAGLKSAAAGGAPSRVPLILNIIEHVSQAVFIMLLVFLVSDQGSSFISSYTIGMGVLLLLYYVLWGFYFSGSRSLPILGGMAVLPVIYFIVAEAWLHCWPAVIPTLIFGVTHLIVTYRSYFFSK